MWSKRYLNIAKEVANWSKDPNKKVGAVIIGSKGQIKSQGYNGFPRGIDDCETRYNDRLLKNKLVCHAEVNAIYNAIHNGTYICGDTMYVTGLPVCHECAKAIIQVGIAKVVYDSPISQMSSWYDSNRLAISLLKEAGVEIVFYV